MCFNDKVSRFAHGVVRKCRRKKQYIEIPNEKQPLLSEKNVENGTTSVTEVLESDLTLKDIDEFGKCTFRYSLTPLALCFFRGIQRNMEMARRNVKGGKMSLGNDVANFFRVVCNDSRL